MPAGIGRGALPTAKKILLVQDNLNTHDGASLYEAFPPESARRLLNKIEWHYTPKHGSWLNMAETEIRIMNGQCLDQRLDSPVKWPKKCRPGNGNEMVGKHASIGRSPSLLHDGNSTNFTRQSKIDGILDDRFVNSSPVSGQKVSNVA